VFHTIFENPSITLYPLNGSHIVVIPKKRGATSPSDFRPISIVHAVQRILSKILAERIQPLLGTIIQPTQTGFVKDMNIFEGFHYAQEVIAAAKKQREQVVIFKADIFKAFGSVYWDFILVSLKIRGFSTKWIQWIRELLCKDTHGSY
jgi:Reverse transcriptase (RNA-dependent DNA polymerase)